MGNSRNKPTRLPEKLLTIRQGLNINQEELAEKLSDDKNKIRKSDISRYESGLREPNLITLLKYSRISRNTLERLVDDSLNLDNI